MFFILHESFRSVVYEESRHNFIFKMPTFLDIGSNFDLNWINQNQLK